MRRLLPTIAVFVCLALARPSIAAEGKKPPPGPTANPFFALCMDTHDGKKRNLAQQAELLKELGYAGAGHLWLKNVPQRLKTLDEAGLKLFQIYMRVNISAKAAKRPYDPTLKTVIPLLKGRRSAVALLMTGEKRSDPAGDARAVEIIREIATLAEPAGVSVVLYPHAGDWIERVEDAVRVARKVDRPNVGVMFNLCHWLKVDQEKNMKRVLALARPHLMAVSIHGADTAAEIHARKGKWIQPLGKGSFDMAKLLGELKALDYRGPIGLQCYGLGGDARVHLTQSIQAWRKLQEDLATPAKKPSRWEGHIRRFEARDEKSPPPRDAILFLGSSSIVRWNTKKWFGDLVTINRGFGGSQVADSLEFAERILIPYRPRTVVFYAGDNDIAAGKTPERVLADYKALVAKTHDRLPETKFIYVPIKPSVSRWKLWPKMKQANGMIEQFSRSDRRLEYLDIATPMLDAAGRPRKELFVKDGLHLSDAGYKLWSSLLRPLLRNSE